jgi:lipoprotein-anchoring transpeptidase ErfK/SrfK
MARALRTVVAVAAIALVTASCSSHHRPVAKEGVAVPVAPVAMPTPTVPEPAPPPAPAPVTATVADARLMSVGIFPAPSADAAPLGTIPNPNSLGKPLVFLVKEQQGDWLHVELPQRPNGAMGWIHANDVTLRPDPWRITIELSAHRLTAYEDDVPQVQVPVAIGTDSTPTPTGDFYIDGLYQLSSPNGPYGAYAFGVTGFSNVLTSFGGGPGQIAIHGTNDPKLIGTPASHGCVRMTNENITKLAALIPTGTPVSIVA